MISIVYTGKVKYGGNIYQGIHQPIISEDIFNLSQGIHKKKKRIMKLYKDYALAGLVKCKECGSYMTPCHTNKKKQGKIKRYYYYRCTKTFKRDWNDCATKQVSANRLEDYIFQNLERIFLDKHYIDSLIFRLNNTPVGDRIGLPSLRSGQAHQDSKALGENLQVGDQSGLEPLGESSKISPKIFEQTLQIFLKALSARKGIEKNLFARKFIKEIIYSKDQIQINLFYFVSLDDKDTPFGVGRWRVPIENRDEPTRVGLKARSPSVQVRRGQALKDLVRILEKLAPRVGLEPTTLRLRVAPMFP